MPDGQATIEVLLLNGKRRDVKRGPDDEVLTIHGGRTLDFLQAAGWLAHILRDRYGVPDNLLTRELRRTREGLVYAATQSRFGLGRETIVGFELPPDVIRAILERGGRDESEIRRWAAPPKAPKQPPKRLPKKAEAVLIMIQHLTEAEDWGRTAPEVATLARCSASYFYRQVKKSDARRAWESYQRSGLGRSPVRRCGL